MLYMYSVDCIMSTIIIVSIVTMIPCIIMHTLFCYYNYCFDCLSKFFMSLMSSYFVSEGSPTSNILVNTFDCID